MAQSLIKNKIQILLIGGSAGSLDLLLRILPALEKNLNIAIVIVLHRNNSDSVLSEVLNDKTSWKVTDAEEKEKIQRNRIYIAPADYHLLIERDKTFSLDFSEKIHYTRPAIDITFETAAEAYGEHTAAILLSGANADGTEGLKCVKDNGGVTIVQDPAEALVPFMPQNAINSIHVDYVLGVNEMIETINKLQFNTL